MVMNNFFENCPNVLLSSFEHSFCALYGIGQPSFFQFPYNKGLEEFESNFFRQAALVQLEVRTDNNNGTCRIVNALAAQILSKSALLAFYHICKTLERSVVAAKYRPSASAVIEK